MVSSCGCHHASVSNVLKDCTVPSNITKHDTSICFFCFLRRLKLCPMSRLLKPPRLWISCKLLKAWRSQKHTHMQLWAELVCLQAISAHLLSTDRCQLTDLWRKQHLCAESPGSATRFGSLHMSTRFCFFWPLLGHCVVVLCRTLCHQVASQCSAHICNDRKRNRPHLRPMLVTASSLPSLLLLPHLQVGFARNLFLILNSNFLLSLFILILSRVKVSVKKLLF